MYWKVSRVIASTCLCLYTCDGHMIGFASVCLLVTLCVSVAVDIPSHSGRKDIAVDAVPGEQVQP